MKLVEVLHVLYSLSWLVKLRIFASVSRIALPMSYAPGNLPVTNRRVNVGTYRNSPVQIRS